MNMNEAFSEARGFGNYKNDAIILLKSLVSLLNLFKIDYFIISGTLLGLVRHNDFIPWDDDIDIIVSADFIQKASDFNKISEYLVYTQIENYMYKFCFRNKIHSINDKYNWPFVDLFVYNTTQTNINFFNKNWSFNEFFPAKTVLFNGFCVSIPKNPHYFLHENYGEAYMDLYNSSVWNHKNEKGERNIYAITKQTYNIFFNKKQNYKFKSSK